MKSCLYPHLPTGDAKTRGRVIECPSNIVNDICKLSYSYTEDKCIFNAAHLNGWNVREAGQVLGIGHRGDELDWTDNGTGWAAVSMSTSHTGASRTCRVGVM